MSFSSQAESYQALLKRYQEIHNLSGISSLLHWDQELMMPPEGAPQRAEQLGTLKKVMHERQTDPAIGELLQELEQSSELESDVEKANLREARRSYDLATKVPSDLVEALGKHEVIATQGWVKARKEDDYTNFWPLFHQMVAFQREYADAIRGDRSRYDELLDQYEPGETAANVKVIFANLRSELNQLLDKIKGSSSPTDPSKLTGHFSQEKQKKFSTQIIQAMGYQSTAGRLDASTHPFCTGTGGDVRITTRYNDTNFSEDIFSCMHEAGHALYEQGLDRSRLGTPSMVAASLGMHESQSRLWENFVGRSLPFWKHFYPALQDVFPSPFQSVELNEFWRLINHVEPSYIRTEADEVTYNLHIILRFEIEQKLIDGSLDVDDLPDFWNQQFHHDFGRTPDSLKTGCLQDIHWPAGIFGYFPTYALGNLYAAQLYEQIVEELPFENLLLQGDLLPIREWLREKIHQQGHTYPSPELVQRVTHRPLSAQPLLTYLNDKFGKIYSF